MKFIFIALFLYPSIVFSQSDSELPYKDGKVVYEQVVDVTGAKKSEIYGASKKWIADAFRSAKAVIESADETTGQIIAKGNTTFVLPQRMSLFVSALKLDISIQIDCKDEKYRLRIYDIRNNVTANGILNEIITPIEEIDAAYKKKKNHDKWDQNVKYLNIHFYNLVESLKGSINKSKSDIF